MPYGVCRICGCTDNDPCHNPTHGNCWWVDETHELCSHCADEKIANDKTTTHCINSNDKYINGVAEVLVCKNCRRWEKDKDSADVMDDVLLPCGLSPQEKMKEAMRRMNRKGGYNELLRKMVIVASLQKKEFNDNFLFAKQ